MHHSLGDISMNIYLGDHTVKNNNFNDLSTSINNSTISGSQFAAGSKDFQGTINNISQETIEQLEKLTNDLVKHIQESPIEGVETSEIIDAVKQVETQVKQKTINKLTIKGILEGIKMVVQNGQGISHSLLSIYTDWNTFIHNLVSS